MSRHYPIFLDVGGRLCLVAGGGRVAARKAETLLECGARVRVVAPKISGAVMELSGESGLEILRERFGPAHMEGAVLAIAATDDEPANRAVYEEAERRGIPVNVVDQPALCTFIVPSVVRRGDLSIAISTSGKSPAVAKRVRKKLETEFGEEWGEYLEMMGEARRRAFSNVKDQKSREKAFNRLADSGLLERIKEGDVDGAWRLVEEIVGR
ncbi:MAG: precorrin-2 dehydrogenase/sirohydrochlorin ferrochelatase family protein [Candidatus Nitrospinota bacterium M3_3B_026]